MAASLQERNRSFRRGRSHKPMSEINVTPFVDVMLVLLVIFMVTAPLLTVGVSVDLPKTKAAALPGQDEPLVVSVNKQGKVYLQETELELGELVPRLVAISGSNPDVRIFIRGDRAIHYGLVLKVMGALNGAGFKKIGLVSGGSETRRKKARKKQAKAK
jgi:biopolymer transport protein TolR